MAIDGSSFARAFKEKNPDTRPHLSTSATNRPRQARISRDSEFLYPTIGARLSRARLSIPNLTDIRGTVYPPGVRGRHVVSRFHEPSFLLSPICGDRGPEPRPGLWPLAGAGSSVPIRLRPLPEQFRDALTSRDNDVARVYQSCRHLKNRAPVRVRLENSSSASCAGHRSSQRPASATPASSVTSRLQLP